MLHAIGHKVQSLRRVGFGPLKLGRLKVGGWRVLGDALGVLQRPEIDRSALEGRPRPTARMSSARAPVSALE